MGRNIPVLSITIDKNPNQFLHGVHAVQYDGDESILKERLAVRMVEWLVREARDNSRALYECADLHEHRTEMMIDYAKRVLGLEKSGMLRQKGALSSLNIPNKPTSHSIWKQRYDGRTRSQYVCRLQLEERRVLEEHVRSAGCRLIIDPDLSYGSQVARQARLSSLVETLESLRDDQVQVGIKKGLNVEEHITMVGRWFMAQIVRA